MNEGLECDREGLRNVVCRWEGSLELWVSGEHGGFVSGCRVEMPLGSDFRRGDGGLGLRGAWLGLWRG